MAKKTKEMKLQTIEDLFRATTQENFELLASHVITMMEIHIHLRKKIGKKRYDNLIFGAFHFTNDSKAEITLTFNGEEMKFRNKYVFTKTDETNGTESE